LDVYGASGLLSAIAGLILSGSDASVSVTAGGSHSDHISSIAIGAVPATQAPAAGKLPSFIDIFTRSANEPAFIFRIT